MTKHALQRIRVPTIPQVLDGERVPEAVYRYGRNASPGADRLKQIQHPVASERPAGLNDEEWIPFCSFLGSNRQVTP